MKTVTYEGKLRMVEHGHSDCRELCLKRRSADLSLRVAVPIESADGLIIGKTYRITIEEVES